jgi:hypothetical protein
MSRRKKNGTYRGFAISRIEGSDFYQINTTQEELKLWNFNPQFRSVYDAERAIDKMVGGYERW